VEEDRKFAPIAARKMCDEIVKRNINVDRAFYIFDADHNGRITLTELKNGINNLLPRETFNLGEVNMALKYFDSAPCDGTISRKEWNATFARVAATKVKE